MARLAAFSKVRLRVSDFFQPSALARDLSEFGFRISSPLAIEPKKRIKIKSKIKKGKALGTPPLKTEDEDEDDAPPPPPITPVQTVNPSGTR